MYHSEIFLICAGAVLCWMTDFICVRVFHVAPPGMWTKVGALIVARVILDAL